MYAPNIDLIMIAEFTFTFAGSKNILRKLLQKVLCYFSYSVMPAILQYFLYCYCYTIAVTFFTKYLHALGSLWMLQSIFFKLGLTGL